LKSSALSEAGHVNDIFLFFFFRIGGEDVHTALHGFPNKEGLLIFSKS